MCLSVSTQALLVVRASVPKHKSVDLVLDRIRSCLVRDSDQSSWPGTELQNARTARVVVFRVDETSSEVLLESVDGLFDWRQPELPEDLCLLTDDDVAVLTSVAHEGDAWVSGPLEFEGKVAELLQLHGVRYHLS